MNWKFTAPDKPIRTNEGFIDFINNQYVAEAKLDGWRCEIGKFNNHLHSISRSNQKFELNNDIVNVLTKIIPEGCSFDTEWINHTRIKAINKEFGYNLPLIERIMVIDITWYNNKYLRSETLAQRISRPEYQNLPILSLDNIWNSPLVFRAIQVSGDKAMELYNNTRNHMICEGIVIKSLKSKINGHASKSIKNNGWFKVKYRG